MPIENDKDGGFMVTGKAIGLYRLMVLRRGLKLEAVGLKMTRGRSCLAVVKSEFGWRGNRAKILGLLETEIERAGADALAESE